MTNPFISIIIPSYNCASYIPKVIKSVLNQTFKDWELIIVDDGSPDDTEVVVNNFIKDNPEKIFYKKIPHSGLPAVARNTGIRMAKGEYIAFLDADDAWYPEKLKKTLEVFKKNPDISLVGTGAHYMHNQSSYPIMLETGQINFRDLLRGNILINSSVVIRRRTIDRVGFLNESDKLRGYEDYEYWLRVSLQAQLWYLAEPLVLYRINPSGLSQELKMAEVQYVSKEMHMLQTILNRPSSLIDSLYLCRSIKYAQKKLMSLSKDAAHQEDFSTPRILKMSSQSIINYYKDHIAAFLLNTKQSTQHQEIEVGKNMLKYHLGCGEVYLEGYINVDYPNSEHTIQSPDKKVDLYSDITKISYPQGKVDEIRLHHVFEHFSYTQALNLLKRWNQALKIGGLLKIETPDFLSCSKKIISPFYSFKTKMKIMRHIFGSQEAAWARHMDGWFENKYRYILQEMGFSMINVKKTAYKDINNITVTAQKLADYSPDEFLIRIKKILQKYLIDNSITEQKLIDVWMKEIEK